MPKNGINGPEAVIVIQILTHSAISLNVNLLNNEMVK